MIEGNYISIKEFAESLGMSPQAIYKQLNKKLKTYVVVIDGKKMLCSSAYEVFEKATKKEKSTVEQQLINLLQTELEKKNEQIKQLQKLLDQEQQLRMVSESKLLQIEEKEKSKWWKKIIK